MTYSEYNDPTISGLAVAPPTQEEKLPDTKGLLLSPFLTLIVFTFINFLAYFDRGALSSVIDTVQTNLNLTPTQAGFLGSAFMIGYCVAAPIFGHIVQKGVESFILFSVGLGIWVLAVVLCGLSSSYMPLLLGRLLSGCGEAGFLIIAPPLIDRMAPSSKKSLWLSVFYTAIPTGYALGFALPSRLLDLEPFAGDTWRSIFILEGIIMIPFVVYGLFNQSPFQFHKDSTKKEIEITEQDLSPRHYDHNGQPHGYVPPTNASNNSDLDLEDYQNVGKNNKNLFLPTEDSTLSLNSYPPSTKSNNGRNNGSNGTGGGDYSSGTIDSYQPNSDDQQNIHFNTDLSGFDQAFNEYTGWKRWITSNPFGKRVFVLCFNPLFISNVLGYSAQTFVTGGFAFSGISYAKAVFKVSPTEAGIVFGGVTLLAGIIGTILGGVWLDYWRRTAKIPSAIEDPNKIDNLVNANPKTFNMTVAEKEEFKSALVAKFQDLHNPNTIKDRLQSIELALRLVIVATSIAIPFALACFLVSDIRIFAVLICVAEISLFCCLSVLNSAIIWSVPFSLSPQAIAMSVVIVHVLGDALSPLIIGLLLEATNKSHRTVMTMCCVPLALAVLIWAMGNGKIVNYLNTIKYFQYKEEPVFVTNSNTLDSYKSISEREFEELQPFVRIRNNLLWKQAEACQ